MFSSRQQNNAFNSDKNGIQLFKFKGSQNFTPKMFFYDRPVSHESPVSKHRAHQISNLT